jgi:hypothetical protein
MPLQRSPAIADLRSALDSGLSLAEIQACLDTTSTSSFSQLPPADTSVQPGWEREYGAPLQQFRASVPDPHGRRFETTSFGGDRGADDVRSPVASLSDDGVVFDDAPAAAMVVVPSRSKWLLPSQSASGQLI